MDHARFLARRQDCQEIRAVAPLRSPRTSAASVIPSQHADDGRGRARDIRCQVRAVRGSRPTHARGESSRRSPAVGGDDSSRAGSGDVPRRSSALAHGFGRPARRRGGGACRGAPGASAGYGAHAPASTDDGPRAAATMRVLWPGRCAVPAACASQSRRHVALPRSRGGASRELRQLTGLGRYRRSRGSTVAGKHSSVRSQAAP